MRKRQERSVEPKRPGLDGEVVELLQDDPELLAIADAVAATQRQVAKRGRRSRRPVAVAVAAGAAAVVALAFLVGGRADLVDDALAAVGDGEVLHTVIRRDVVGEEIINTRSGATRPVRVRVEAWTDEERGRLRLRTFRDGRLVVDTLSEVRSLNGEGAGLDPTAHLFVTGYRAALRARQATRGASSDLVIERDRLMATVTLSEKLRPIRLTETRSADGSYVPWRVLSMRSEPLRAGTFDAPDQQSHPTRGRVIRQRALSVGQAARALAGAGIWSGPRVADLKRRGIKEQVLKRQLSDGGSATRLGLEISYQGASGRFVRLRQALQPDPAYGFAEGRYTFAFVPIPPEGEAVIAGPATQNASGVWRAQLRHSGVFLTVLASERDLLLRAIRSLRPIS